MYLVESGTPLYATQRNSFKTMLHEFGIELSSRQTLESTVLPAIFLAVYRDIQTHLKTADVVCVSFDGWKKSGNVHVLLGEVYTYITPDWNYHSDLVQIIPVWGSPTATHLQTLVQYGLQHNLQNDALVVACVTDNESAYRLAAHMIADTVAYGYHTLELCVEDICWEKSSHPRSVIEKVMLLLIPILFSTLQLIFCCSVNLTGLPDCESYFWFPRFNRQVA